MPHKGLVERGYPQTKIFQTHGAASLDLIRVGGKDVEGSFVSTGPAMVADLLPESNPSKALGMRYVADRVRRRPTARARPTSSVRIRSTPTSVLEQRIVPEALKKGKPGTKEFRAALKEALETTGRILGIAGRAQLHCRPITTASRPTPECCWTIAGGDYMEARAGQVIGRGAD